MLSKNVSNILFADGFFYSGASVNGIGWFRFLFKSSCSGDKTKRVVKKLVREEKHLLFKVKNRSLIDSIKLGLAADTEPSQFFVSPFFAPLFRFCCWHLNFSNFKLIYQFFVSTENCFCQLMKTLWRRRLVIISNSISMPSVNKLNRTWPTTKKRKNNFIAKSIQTLKWSQCFFVVVVFIHFVSCFSTHFSFVYRLFLVRWFFSSFMCVQSTEKQNGLLKTQSGQRKNNKKTQKTVWIFREFICI